MNIYCPACGNEMWFGEDISISPAGCFGWRCKYCHTLFKITFRYEEVE